MRAPQLTLVGSRDDNIYVGTRVEVRVRFTDSWTDEPLNTLTPQLTFIAPDNTPNDAGIMTILDDEGSYSGSYVPSTDGNWTVTVELGSPFETYRRFNLYVSPRETAP